MLPTPAAPSMPPSQIPTAPTAAPTKAPTQVTESPAAPTTTLLGGAANTDAIDPPSPDGASSATGSEDSAMPMPTVMIIIALAGGLLLCIGVVHARRKKRQQSGSIAHAAGHAGVLSLPSLPYHAGVEVANPLYTSPGRDGRRQNQSQLYAEVSVSGPGDELLEPSSSPLYAAAVTQNRQQRHFGSNEAVRVDGGGSSSTIGGECTYAVVCGVSDVLYEPVSFLALPASGPADAATHAHYAYARPLGDKPHVAAVGAAGGFAVNPDTYGDTGPLPASPDRPRPEQTYDDLTGHQSLYADARASYHPQNRPRPGRRKGTMMSSVCSRPTTPSGRPAWCSATPIWVTPRARTRCR